MVVAQTHSFVPTNQDVTPKPIILNLSLAKKYKHNHAKYEQKKL